MKIELVLSYIILVMTNQLQQFQYDTTEGENKFDFLFHNDFIICFTGNIY